ncbi:MAG: lamin tail domain-containing protein [Phycisphaeraceae bacterium]|nr:lamin tail domain-containing protein [Phycisphaeraceae bacterium]
MGTYSAVFAAMVSASVVIVCIADPPAEPAPAAPDAATAPKPGANSIVPYPHPLITEILYAVPGAGDGDANGDGKRDAAGDEFVEFINPHDRPINLRGYTITDRNEGRAQLRFTFPALELPPGGVVVVFNGQGQKWKGPVGTTKSAPAEGNAAFHGAYVFTIDATSSSISWANGGDWVLLSDPSGEAVHCVWWGKFAEKKPEKGLVEEAPLVSRSSVTRRDPSSALFSHSDLAKPLYSPGEFGDPAERAPAGG